MSEKPEAWACPHCGAMYEPKTITVTVQLTGYEGKAPPDLKKKMLNFRPERLGDYGRTYLYETIEDKLRWERERETPEPCPGHIVPMDEVP